MKNKKQEKGSEREKQTGSEGSKKRVRRERANCKK
jgi:hypothetical protein